LSGTKSAVPGPPIVDGTEVGERLSILFDAFNALSNANKAARRKFQE
jgi:hypothetical protein